MLGEKTPITGVITGYSYTFNRLGFPSDFGVTAKLENTSFDEGFYDYITNRTFLISGTFKSKTIWWGKKVGIKSQEELAEVYFQDLLLKYLGGVDRFDLQTYTFELGVERHFENFLGSFAIGLSYKKRWIQLEDSTSSSFINDLNTNDTSYGIYFAQRFGKER